MKMTNDIAIRYCDEYLARHISDIDKEFLKIAKEALQQEPCKDAISRKAVHDGLANIAKAKARSDAQKALMGRIMFFTEQLPPVNPQKPICPSVGVDCEDCPAYEKKTEWIPVSERLPEKFRYVNCTCHSLIDDREDWVIETVYIPQPSNSPYSDWGNIPMLNDKQCEVIAWVYREIPKPYKAEGSGEE